MNAKTSNASPGRPRDAKKHQAILKATVALLRETGYTRLTIEGVAKRAKVGKPAIYRRWSHKGLLVYEAVFSELYLEPISNSGDLKTDLTVLMRLIRDLLYRPEARSALLGLLADISTDAQLHQMFFENWADPLTEHFLGIVKHAQDRGELPPEIPFDLVVHSLMGTVFVRSVMQLPSQDSDIDRLVDLIIRGVKFP